MRPRWARRSVAWRTMPPCERASPTALAAAPKRSSHASGWCARSRMSSKPSCASPNDSMNTSRMWRGLPRMSRDEANVRHPARRHRIDCLGAALAADRRGNQDRLPRPRVLWAAARRRTRTHVHGAEIPLHDRRRRASCRSEAGGRRRSANHARRTRAARDSDGRIAAALEHLPWRHELRRSARAPSRGDRRRRRRRAGASARDSRIRRALDRAARPDRHRADLRAARRLAPAEIQVRSPVHPAALLSARRAPHPSLVLDHDARHMGSAGKEVLIERGYYAAKQIFCRDRLVAWSHRRRFEVGLALATRFRGKRILDYGCGDGTFLALLWKRDDRPASAVGAELDAFQVEDCRARLGNLPDLRFEPIAHLDEPSHHGAYDGVVCMEVLEHVVAVDAVV